MACKLETRQDLNYSDHSKALRECIKKNFRISVVPNVKGGYKKYKETYEDYQGMEELDEKALLEEFNGFDNSTAGDFPFPIKVALPHVAYDDTNQGRNPFNVLVSAIFSYGIGYGEKLAGLYENSNCNYRMRFAMHALEFSHHGDNEEIKYLYYQESQEIAKPGSDYMEIMDKYKYLRSVIKMKELHHLLREVFGGKLKKRIAVVKSNYKRLGRIWEILSDMLQFDVCKKILPKLKQELRNIGVRFSIKKAEVLTGDVFIFSPLYMTKKKKRKVKSRVKDY